MATTSPQTRRRFLPEPIEVSSRTSKRPHSDSTDRPDAVDASGTSNTATITSNTKPRRFLPQPVEETSWSSRQKKDDNDKTSLEDSDPATTSETTSKPARRRFAPEPIETSSRTTRRKFAPEPVEISTRSSKDKPEDNRSTSPTNKPRRKFAPQPVETTTTRRRRKTNESSDSPPESSSETSSKVSSRKSSGGRKFAPELIETAKGQYRMEKKEDGLKSPRKNSSPQKSHSSDSWEAPESRFSAAALARRHYEERRRHSYCVPNLPMIESDSSGEESPQSVSKSFDFDSSDNEPAKLEVIAEGENTSYMDYVYSLADRQKLQEQAMAAYINENPHEPFSHFAVEDDEDDDPHGILSGKEGADPRTFRRSSQEELDIEMSSMRKHHEQLERAKNELAQDTAGVSRFSAAALAARHHLNLGHHKQADNGKNKKPKDEKGEMAKMRAAASPPMAGAEIVFPYTVSPRMTRCDVDQPPRPRRADSDEGPKEIGNPVALWTASVTVANKSNAGLWMGMCQKGPEDVSRPPTPIKSGLQTPAFEGPNPFDAVNRGGSKSPLRAQVSQGPQLWGGLQYLAVSPARTTVVKDDFTDSIDKKLQMEKQIDEEFPNKVVTQIYNYLSLGYPSLARAFDDELSKISRIPVEDLRKDDKVAQSNAKGYIGAPESEGSWEEDENGVVQGCRRWEALKLYIREWARQSPNFANELAGKANGTAGRTGTKRNEAWGATVRKGSWAL